MCYTVYCLIGGSEEGGEGDEVINYIACVCFLLFVFFVPEDINYLFIYVMHLCIYLLLWIQTNAMDECGIFVVGMGYVRFRR